MTDEAQIEPNASALGHIATNPPVAPLQRGQRSNGLIHPYIALLIHQVRARLRSNRAHAYEEGTCRSKELFWTEKFIGLTCSALASGG